MGPSMELRDYFAGQAVVPLLAFYERPDFSYTVTKKETAHRAYEMADAMIEIRASKSAESPGTDSQQLKVSIALLQRWYGAAKDLGILTGLNPSLIVETNAVIAQQKTV